MLAMKHKLLKVWGAVKHFLARTCRGNWALLEIGRGKGGTALRAHNPWVLNLLKWHGHDSGGVRVPFQEDTGNPLGTPIETELLKRLRGAARAISTGAPGPRAIFLVGGPGNGKSEAVQVFLEELGEALGCKEELKTELERRFKPSPVSPPIVELAEDGNEPALVPLWRSAGSLTIPLTAQGSVRNSSSESALTGSIASLDLIAAGSLAFACRFSSWR